MAGLLHVPLILETGRIMYQLLMQHRRHPRAAAQPQKESLRDDPAGMSASSACSASSSSSIVTSTPCSSR